MDLDKQTLKRWAAVAAAASGTVVVANWVHQYLRASRVRRALKNVPKANYKHTPLFGNLPDLAANILRLNEWRKEVSDGMPVCWLDGLAIDPRGITLVVRGPELVKHILKDNFPNYTKPSARDDAFVHYFTKWLGDGMFVVRHGPGAADGGASWTKQRKVAAGIFSRGNFTNNMQQVFIEKATRLRELLRAPAEAGEPVDLQLKFFSFTMDSIMRIFFNAQCNTLDGEANVYAEAYDTAHRAFCEYFYKSAAYLKFTQILFPYPIGGVGGLLWKLHDWLSPVHWTYLRAIRTLDSESRRMVQAAREDPKLAERKDLLALFVGAEAEEKFTTMFLRDVVLNFIIAGRDTTACALSWMFYLLTQNPDVQEKLCKEIDEKLPEGAVPSFKSVTPSEMPYLNGVWYEALRLFPPVPFDMKTTVADDVLPDGTPMPKGSEVWYLPYAMGRDASRYPEPLQVKPERWIPFTAPPPHEFTVFQAGPRICLGMDMASFEAKIVASMLLQEYTFSLKEGEAEKISLSFTLTMPVCNSKTLDSHELLLIPNKRR